MSLLDSMKTLCDRLAPLGWRDLLREVTGGQLDISAPTAAVLGGRLTQTVLPSNGVDRSRPGFEDFAAGPTAPITPGSPARSLLYHALASPGVRTGVDGSPLGGFPTLAELDLVENFIFAARHISLADLAEQLGHQPLSVVVFSCEYRPAKDTCSRRQADLVFGRTGISRVGTAPAKYLGEERGFWLEDPSNPFAVRVCPARYVAYLAVHQPGNPAEFVPMRPQPGDANRQFWRPVHKLFEGSECLSDVPDLRLDWSAPHVNDKIRRIHTKVLGEPENQVPTTPPYRLTTGIAALSSDPSLGPGVLVPVVHPRLVEPAKDANGDFVTFHVPRNNGNAFAALQSGAEEDPENAFGQIRNAPNYIHSRTQVEVAGGNVQLIDLNLDAAHPDVRQVVRDGAYDALHYVDFSGEGTVKVTCAALNHRGEIAGPSRAAYSLVSAPDFFPMVGQRELSEWASSLPAAIQREIWAVDPDPLCDVRLPANQQIPGISFDRLEDTVTALVPLKDTPPVGSAIPVSRDARRHSSLSDDSAGVFAPGWDTSQDIAEINGQKVTHLAAYGLGSPFPEDAKLCAALSTFWPAVAPDTARSVLENVATLKGTVAPLADDEIGQTGSVPWDGVPGPRLIVEGGETWLEGPDFLHIDYVEMALNNRFSARITARISLDEYVARVLAMARIYRAHSSDLTIRDQLFVISFRAVSAGDAELQLAETQATTVLTGNLYRVDLCLLPQTTQQVPGDARRRKMRVLDRELFFVGSSSRFVLRRGENVSAWAKFDSHF